MEDHSVASSSEEELSALQNSDRPTKRRRLDNAASSQQRYEDVESDSDDYDLPPHDDLPSSQYDYNDHDSPRGVAKSKYLTHVPQYEEPQEKTFVTQLTQPHSSPSRIRGPRWKKQPPPSAVIAPDTSATSHARSEARDRAPPPLPPRQTEGDELFDEFDEDDPVVLEAMLRSPKFRQSYDDEVLVPSSQNELPGTSESRKLPTSFRQTTLFGTNTTAAAIPASQSRVHNWPLTNKVELPTHHKLNLEAMKTWVYPTNLGKIRDYQFNITSRGLFHNLLVALPTGLGKTFIAATIMLNWFRWTADAQIVFVAPTKPLVSQQIEACFNIAGIPRSQTSMLTGVVKPAIRAEEWQEKRVFFMTPQTLMSDLQSGICDPKKIVLLVVDEAHRATGAYAYVTVVKFLRRFTTSFRVLALTATPGSSVEAVQNVIDSLDIARTEIRTEESLDIRQFVHARDIDLEVFENSEELTMSMDLFGRAIQPVMNKLSGQNALWSRDPMSITAYGLTQSRRQWMASEVGRKANFGLKGMVNAIFNVLASLAHALDLLKYHGIGPFYGKMRAFEEGTLDGGSNSKYAKEIATNEHFKKLMNRLKGWINDSNFVGHPKLSYLQQVVLDHFMDAGEGQGAAGGRPPSDTRIMVFVNFRDSAEEITRILKRHEPMIRPHVFVGQSTTKESQGMDQKTQLDIVDKFQKGTYNTIVATSIGEEGLDIGEVDLIVCYDSHASPIRMLQRMGRTGRKRAGKIVLLLMKGKEAESYAKAKDNYEVMQKKIAKGSDFNYHDDRSPRIMPKEIIPVVDKRKVEIPIENTQAELPEPKRRGRKPLKKPEKRFHMPDGVETGFAYLGEGKKTTNKPIAVEKVRKTSADRHLASLPVLENVLLSPEDEEILNQTYGSTGGDTPQLVERPNLGKYPSLQRTPRQVSKVAHSSITQRLVRTFALMQDTSLYTTPPHRSGAQLEYNEEHFQERRPFRGNESQLAPASTDIRSSGTVTSPGDALARRETGSHQRRSNDLPVDDDLETEQFDSATMPKHLSDKAQEPFYVSQQSVHEEDDLDDVLPDFGTLVSAKKTSQKDGSTQKNRRRLVRRMRVLSDDEDSD